jgi:hypothetical protein
MGLSEIQTFETLFNLFEFRYGRGAAAYYVTLIEQFPTNLQRIKESAKGLLLKNIRPAHLKEGRQELLEKGFLARVITSDADNFLRFDREAFLPVNPRTIWEDAIHNETYKAKSDILFKTRNEKKFREESIIELEKIYKEKFKKFGIGTETGSVTMHYSGQWALYFLLNALDEMPHKNFEALFMLGGLGSMSRLGKYYENALKKGAKIKIIFEDEIEDNIKKALKLRELYPSNIELRYTPIQYLTTRRIILDNMVLSGDRLLPAKRNEPTFIGTIYLQKEIIEYIKNHFMASWGRWGPSQFMES